MFTVAVAGPDTVRRKRKLGLRLLALVPVFAILALGFAFTIFGLVAEALTVVALVGAIVVLALSRRRE